MIRSGSIRSYLPTAVRRRRGFTLAELAISVVSTSILMLGMVSAIMIATKAASTGNASNGSMNASLALAEFASELATAKSFSERTATAVTFTVGDRDGNNTDETIRYTWAGQAGNPLLRYYNGTPTTAAADVHSFNLVHTAQRQKGTKRILFVRGNVNGTRGIYDNDRRDLVEGFGFQVIPLVITSATLQSEINTYLAAVDAVYISATAAAADVGTKFNAATVGVIVENGQLFDDLKLYATSGSTFTDKRIKRESSSHLVTAEMDSGPVDILDHDQVLNYFPTSSSLAAGAVVLCKQESGPLATVVAIDKGGTLRDGTPAPGRRVTLPWGTIDFPPDELMNNNGKEIFSGALAWASYGFLQSRVDVTLQIGWSGTSNIRTIVELFGDPAL